ncbi:ATPase family associated with various cellular activities (AAA) [Blastococcus sp. DSM 46786]|uniref:ATP-binding protein n=1 Tax=Blastococcus sp. DSM 46786 TaxID=1798227 RepID=UPI0008D81190|nr:ATP-binding protein [Blastococcus sp. DSM 46786]SEK59484.1 ATPase family associated with various cellular activities (AAA) [Blastococcus sp. DSM 46786]
MTLIPASPAIEWMRDAAVLAAECSIRQPHDAPIAPREGWPGTTAAWDRMAGRAAAIDLPAATWVTAAAAAAELHPDAAAAFSILAENERVALPVPAGLARIAVAGLGLTFDEMLAAALAPSTTVDRVEIPGHTLPAAQTGLRLSAEALADLLGRRTDLLGSRDAATHRPVFPEAARAARRVLAEDGTVWIRGRSRRLARQLAFDVAALHPSAAAVFLPAPPGQPVPASGTAAVDALEVLDLFELDGPPRLILGDRERVVVAPERFEHPGVRGIDAPVPGPVETAAIWATARLPEPDRAQLAARFRLTLPELREAEREAGTLAAVGGADPDARPDAAALARAVRAAGARRMGPFVTVVDTTVTLDDLVATPEMHARLADAVAWRRNDDWVWQQMGLPSDGADARGLSLLFSGPPGGGKTFAARCLANSLGLNLYRVDLSQVVSKYIGETEKRLAQIFDEAEAGHGVLFFDEADAVFGQRSEVKDAHDRYANIEVGFLLQRVESFGGVMVLATNLRANLDPAFLRRIQLLVEFPLPGRQERAVLWDRNLPPPRWRGDDLDVADLAARFRISGGNVRNVAVAAAHRAAQDRAPVGMRHLAPALYRELEKSGHPRGRAELGRLADHLEGLG